MTLAEDYSVAHNVCQIKFLSVRFHMLFTPFKGFFSPFVHTTCSLSVSQQYLALGGR